MIIIDTKTLVTIAIEVIIVITILVMIPPATIVVVVAIGEQTVAVQHIATSPPEHDLDFMMTMKEDIMKKI